MFRLNWMFCNGSNWFQSFDTEEEAIDYVHRCDLLRAHTVERVWVSSDKGEVWLREKN